MTTASMQTAALLPIISPESRSKTHPGVSWFSYDRKGLKKGIVHIGVGNFFRSHEALFVDHALHLPGQSDWGIVGVGLGGGDAKVRKAAEIKAQDCLYTLTEYAPNGAVFSFVIGAMIDYLHAPADPAAVLDALVSPDTRIVSLTITEGGYNIDESSKEFVLSKPDVAHDLQNPGRPTTAFGYIVEALARRRDAGLGGFTVVSCDNLRSNGNVARKAVLGFARARDPALATWIDAHCSFPNSMVDRIAPSVGPAEKARANANSGIADETPITGESFIQWVIEDKFVAGRPAFETVGVELRSDVAAFEAIKGRLLNASHMMMCYPALLAGHRIVDYAMRDPLVLSFLRTFMDIDAIPLITAPAGVSLEVYKNTVIERFSNPAVGDQLLRIAHDGASKLPIFLTKTLTELLERGGSFRRVALNLAAFEQYLKGVDLDGAVIAVDEPNLTESDRALLASDDVCAVLKLSCFAPLRLAEHPQFREAFEEARQRLRSEGVRSALIEAVAR